jgi:hypothetical protein
MHNIIFPSTEPFYVICYTENVAYHYGVMTSNQCMETGQEIVETYTNEQEYKNRALQLGFEISEYNFNNNDEDD